MLIATVKLSWMSQAIGIADNMAQLVAMNVAVNSYLNNAGSYEIVNPVIVLNNDGSSYSPLLDFNEMLVDYGISTDGVNEIIVKWDSVRKVATVSFNEDGFVTTTGDRITPHDQESKIELE